MASELNMVLLESKICGSKYTHCRLTFWSTLPHEAIIRLFRQDWQIYVSRDNVSRSRNENICCGKAVSTIYSECVSVVSIIRRAKRMRLIILSSVACPALHIFPHFLIKVTNAEKKNRKCGFWYSVQLLSEIFLPVKRTEQNNLIKLQRSSRKAPVIFVRFYWKFQYLDTFRKYSKIPNSRQFVQWEPSCCLRKEGQTCMTKSVVAFCNIAKGS